MLLIVIILLFGCASKNENQTPGQSNLPNEIGPAQDQQVIDNEISQEEDNVLETEDQILGEQKEIEEEEIIVKPEEPKQQTPQPPEEDPIKEIFSYAKTKLTSYSYQYRDASGVQYNIYVKGSKMKIDYISEVKQIYLDTQKKTAEAYCISHSRCGKQTGKLADLDYSTTYIKTPVDWISDITEAKKIDEGFYLGKAGWTLETNIGEVIIDSKYGFIYSIKQKDKSYSFTNTAFNVVQDSDVNIPEYLIPK